MQMGTTRANCGRRFDEVTWEQCYDGATTARWSLSIVYGDHELGTRKISREMHKRISRPHQQVEHPQVGEYDRRNTVGSHTNKNE